MKFKKLFMMALAASVLAGSFAGCGKAEEESRQVKVDTEDPAWKEAMTTPYGKYPETVNLNYS